MSGTSICIFPTRQLCLLLLGLLAVGTKAFLPSIPSNHNVAASPSTTTRSPFCRMSSDASEAEIQEMEELILSLSLEPTDESRRERLVSVFDEALSRPNGMPKEFADLFDQTLIVVGDRIKAELQQKAQEQALQAEEEEDDDNLQEKSAEDDDDKPDGKKKVAFANQRQLWALVDMMVQSKTIVKKDSGELGSKGVFQ